MRRIPDDPLVRHVIEAVQQERRDEAVRVVRDAEMRKLEVEQRGWLRRLAGWFRKRPRES
jgi:hypothetical protein